VRTLRYVTAAAATLCAAAAAGCASSSTQSQPAAPPSTVTITQSAPASPASASPSPAAAAPAACATSSLRVSLGASDGYAGGVYQPVNFTNTSDAPCTLFGYPGVSLVSGSSHRQIGLAAKRSATVPARQVTLAPGATAHAVLQIVDALNFPSSSCAPAKATELRVYPPGQTVPVYVATTAQGCARPQQVLFVTAVQAGSGR
jgi:Protein of unknown function (DUF4232)